MVCMYLRQARPRYLGMMQVLVDYVNGGGYRWESKVLTTTLSWSLVCLRSGPQWIEIEDVHKLEFCGIRTFVRHVNFIWFVFTFSDFCLLDLYNVTRIALAKSWWSITETGLKIKSFPSLIMVIGSVCLLISWLNREVLSIVLTVECGVDNMIWRHNPISFEHVSICCLFIWSWWFANVA